MIGAVLSPGPSLADVTVSDVSRYIYRVAVNTAVGRSDLKPTHWLTSDVSGFRDSQCPASLDVPLIHPAQWTQEKEPLHSDHLSKWDDPHLRHVFLQHERIPVCKQSLAKQLREHELGYNWRIWSSLTGIAWLISQGADQPHLFGADMRGHTYMTGDDRKIEWSEDHRWRTERRHLAEMMCGGRRNGIKIFRKF